jgi:hypothetical protein
MINFDDSEIEDLKNQKLLDSNIFFRNNKFFKEICDLSTYFDATTNTNLRDFFLYLNNNFNINDNSGTLFVNPSINRFENTYFKLDSSHNYQTTVKDSGLTRFVDSSGLLVDCSGFIWKSPYQDNIQYIEIIKDTSNYYQAFDSNSAIRSNKDISIEQVINSIYDNFAKSDQNFSYTKCNEFTTQGTFKSLTDPSIFKNVMKNSIDNSDIYEINPNFFIIKSRNILYFYGKILIIEQVQYTNGIINYLKIKPSISFINVNSPYDEALKTLFRQIKLSLNTFFGQNKIQLLPVGFYHIHITKVKNENKLLLILHTYTEEFLPPTSTPPFVKKYNYNGNYIDKIKSTVTLGNRDYMLKHNNLVIVDLDNSTMLLLGMNPTEINNVKISNKLFHFSI